MNNIVEFQTTTKNDTFEGTVTLDVATKKKTTTSFDVIEVCEDSDPANCEDVELDKSDEKNQTLKIFRKFIKKCMIIRSRYVM